MPKDGFKSNPGWQELERGAVPHDGALKFGNGFNWTGMNFGAGSGWNLQEGEGCGCALNWGARP